MSESILPLKVAKDIEPLRTWENILTPYDVAVYVARICGVDISQISSLSEIIFSSIEPVGADRKKIFINTSGVPSIGIPIGGQYQMIYQYPPNVPFLWTTGNIPSYIRELTEDEMTRYSIAIPVDSTAKWVIFNP